MKKIKILVACSAAGKPVQPGELLEVEDFAAGYLISIGKAEEMPEQVHEVEPEPALERKADEGESRSSRRRFERKPPPAVKAEENA